VAITDCGGVHFRDNFANLERHRIINVFCKHAKIARILWVVATSGSTTIGHTCVRNRRGIWLTGDTTRFLHIQQIKDIIVLGRLDEPFRLDATLVLVEPNSRRWGVLNVPTARPSDRLDTRLVHRIEVDAHATQSE
jgi:hypothetical protein